MAKSKMQPATLEDHSNYGQDLFTPDAISNYQEMDIPTLMGAISQAEAQIKRIDDQIRPLQENQTKIREGVSALWDELFKRRGVQTTPRKKGSNGTRSRMTPELKEQARQAVLKSLSDEVEANIYGLEAAVTGLGVNKTQLQTTILAGLKEEKLIKSKGVARGTTYTITAAGKKALSS